MKLPSLVGFSILLSLFCLITVSALSTSSTNFLSSSVGTSTKTSPSSSSAQRGTSSSSSSSRNSSSTSSTVSAKSSTSSSTLSRSTTSTTGLSSSKTSSLSKSSSTSTKSSSTSQTSSSSSVKSSSSSKSTSVSSSQGKTSSTQSSGLSSSSSIKSSSSSKTSSISGSQLKSTSTQSSQSSSSSSIKSSTTSKSPSPSQSGSSSTIFRSTSSTKVSSTLKTAITSTLTQETPSVILVTPNGCPWLSTGSLIWQNATSETSAVGIFGTFDQYGYPATATRLGVWNGSRINGLPDLVIDITNPSILVASFTKDLHNVVFDTVNNQMHVSNCSVEAIVPIHPTMKKRQSPDTGLAPSIQGRQVYKSAGSIQVTLTYTTPCGNPDQWQNPTIDCYNETPGFWPNMIAPVPQVIQTSPGVYSATCYFPDTIDGRRNSPLCKNIYPLLTAVCKLNGDTSAPVTGGLLEAYCIYLGLTIVLEELAAICEVFALGLALYCSIQDEFNGGPHGSGFQDALCGPDVASTDIGIRVVSSYPHDTWYNPALELGSQNSRSPKNINVAVPNKVFQGAKCTPCTNSNQQWLTPWVQVYAGNLFLRNNFGCPGYWYSGYLGDSSHYSFGSAQAQCQSIAEDNRASVWFANSETFTYNDGSPPAGPFFGCWVTGCDIQASDFTLDLNALNPSARSFIEEDIVAFHRTVEWVNCVS